MDWQSYIKSRCADAVFERPAAPQELQRCEDVLGVKLPSDLRELMAQSNGVRGPHRTELVWSVEEIITQNRTFRNDPDYRELYMSFDSLLFFANAVNGDMFGFPIQAGAIRRPDVFVWDHETDSRTWVALDLARYLNGHISGELG